MFVIWFTVDIIRLAFETPLIYMGIQYPQRKPLHFYPILSCVYPILSCVYPILSCVYPIMFSVYPIVKTVYQVLRLSCIRFCVYQVLRFSCNRFCVYRVNRNTSAFSWTNKRKTQRSPTFCYFCRVIKYCWFLFAVTICICFLKLKKYQYYYNFNSNSLWLHCFFNWDCISADRAKKYVWIKIPADKNYCMFWCANHVPAIKIFTGVTF